MNRALLIIVVIAALAGAAWFVLREPEMMEETGVADAVEEATEAVEEAVEETVEAVEETVEEAVEETVEAAEEATTAAEETATEAETAVEGAADEAAAAADAAASEVADAAETATGGLGDLLTVDGFDYDQVIAAIDGSDLSDFRKASQSRKAFSTTYCAGRNWRLRPARSLPACP
jgi:cytoskeletal protein RodZ